MHNKKIIARGLVIGIMMSNIPVDSSANAINEYEIIKEENRDAGIKKDKFNLLDNMKNIIFKIIEPKEEKKIIKINRNIVEGSVLEISLADGEFVPDLMGNPDGYETIIVTTTGNKKLDETDFSRLNSSKIPNIDLSNASASYIAENAFEGNINLKTIKFPKGLLGIKPYAFSNCVNLTGNLIIPQGVTGIGTFAFYGCISLNGTLSIPNSVSEIQVSAFEGCSGLTGDLILPNNISLLGQKAFFGCSGFNGKLKLPEFLSVISPNAFNGCSGFIGDLVISEGVRTIGNNAFNGCSGLDGKLVLPNSLTVIGDNSFKNCTKLKGDLILPDTITKIGISSFEGCKSFSGQLVIPNKVTSIGSNAFKNCTKFKGDLLIPNSLITLGNSSVFTGCNSINKIIIKVETNDSHTNYRKDIIDNLDSSKTIIELPYKFPINETWITSTDKQIGIPEIKNIVNGIEEDLIEDTGEKVSLYIPTPYKSSNIKITKDNLNIDLPIKDKYGKYIFSETGVYNITIRTDLGSVSNINFNIYNALDKAKDAVVSAEESLDVIDINNARDKVNRLPESTEKDELQNRLNNLSLDMSLETKMSSANLDLYIKSENMLLMSLNTNSVTFEDFSGIEDVEKINAVNITINSSLPYQLNAYLPTEIQNADKTNTMDKRILNIKENSEVDYKEFLNINEKVILKDNCPAGNDLTHGVDLKLVGGIAHEKDVYKTTIKFEAEQK